MSVGLLSLYFEGSKLVRFLAKNIAIKGNHKILGMILESKVFQKSTYQKNAFYKKCSPKLLFLFEKHSDRFG